MATMQVYWVETRPQLLEQAKPGQFVHKADGDDMVRGFVSEVDREGERLLIVLFKPTEVKPFATVVHAQVDEDFWVQKLREAIQANPEAGAHWRTVLGNSFSVN